MFKSLSCWNQQTIPFAVFPEAGSWQWKMSVSSSSDWGVCVCVCAVVCVLYACSYVWKRKIETASEVAVAVDKYHPYVCMSLSILLKESTAARCWPKSLRSEFVRLVSVLPLLPLISSMRWLNGSLRGVFIPLPAGPSHPHLKHMYMYVCVFIRCTWSSAPLTDREERPVLPTALLQPLNLRKKVRFMAVGLWLIRFMHSFTIFLLFFVCHTFCWSCWRKLKSFIVVFHCSLLVSWFKPPWKGCNPRVVLHRNCPSDVLMMYLMLMEI